MKKVAVDPNSIEDTAKLIIDSPSEGEGAKFGIFIRSPCGKRWKLDADPKDSIQVLKLKIHKKEFFPVERQKLLFNKKKLEDNETLKALSIGNEATIDLELSMDVSVIIVASPVKIVQLSVFRSDLVKLIKTEVKEKEGIPECQQRFVILMGKALGDDKTLESYRIFDGSSVHLVLRPFEPSPKKAKSRCTIS